MGFPGGSDGKGSTCSAGDPASILGSGNALEEGMATHSSILAWRIPWTEGPGEVQSIGSQSYYCIIAAMTLIICKSVLHNCHIFSHNINFAGKI